MGVAVGEGVGVGDAVTVAVGDGVGDGVVLSSGDCVGVRVGVAVRVGVVARVGVPGTGVDVGPFVDSPATVEVSSGAALPPASWAARTWFSEPSRSSMLAPDPWSWLSSWGRRDEAVSPGGAGVTTEPSAAYCMQPVLSSPKAPRLAVARRRVRRAGIRSRMRTGYRSGWVAEYRADSDSGGGEPLAVAECRFASSREAIQRMERSGIVALT